MQPDGKKTENGESERCLTKHINNEFSSCLAGERRYRCNHAFLFGDGYLCTHPKHREFA